MVTGEVPRTVVGAGIIDGAMITLGTGDGIGVATGVDVGDGTAVGVGITVGVATGEGVGDGTAVGVGVTVGGGNICGIPGACGTFGTGGTDVGNP